MGLANTHVSLILEGGVLLYCRWLGAVTTSWDTFWPQTLQLAGVRLGRSSSYTRVAERHGWSRLLSEIWLGQIAELPKREGVEWGKTWAWEEYQEEERQEENESRFTPRWWLKSELGCDPETRVKSHPLSAHTQGLSSGQHRQKASCSNDLNHPNIQRNETGQCGYPTTGT